MAGLVILFILSLFLIYYGLAYGGVLPYFEIISNSSNMYFVLIHGVLAKWSIVFGVITMIFVICSAIFSNDEDTKFNSTISKVIVFCGVYSLLLII